jgi:hypothetical protein
MEVWTQVMAVYPRTNKEKCCRLHALKMEHKRAALYKRLMNDYKGEKRVHFGGFESKRPI